MANCSLSNGRYDPARFVCTCFKLPTRVLLLCTPHLTLETFKFNVWPKIVRLTFPFPTCSRGKKVICLRIELVAPTICVVAIRCTVTPVMQEASRVAGWWWPFPSTPRYFLQSCCLALCSNYARDITKAFRFKSCLRQTWPILVLQSTICCLFDFWRNVSQNCAVAHLLECKRR